MKKVFIGLGSNLDDPLSQLKKAIEYLKQHKMLNVINISTFYSSLPMGPQDQPDFINAVVEIATSLSAEQLLDELQKIERQQGRERKQHWGARTLDLDILLYGSEVINTERLMVPHRGISERNFVLYPLNDLVEKNFRIPGLGKISELLTTCPMTGITRLSEA
jgi:2-amino-4-hydroxy-6-hydroxymethyldihydropteridine diphosphokinase